MQSQSYWLGIEDKDEWLQWLHKLPVAFSDAYSHPEYLELHAGAGTTSQCFIYTQGENIFLYSFLQQVTPYLARYFDIYTAYGYGGPLSNTNELTFLKCAFSEFYAQAKQRNIVAEVIKFNPLHKNHAILMDVYPGSIIPVCNTVFVNIDLDEEYRWSKEYTAANRKGINKSIRADVTVQFTQDAASWVAFEQLYNETMRFNAASDFYYFSPEYFSKIRCNLSDNYVLASAVVDSTIASSMIILHGEAYAYCHLIGTNRDYLRIGINNFLHHRCIEWCKSNGFQKLLIGGGRGTGDDDSLLRFKMNFSKELSMFHVGEYVLDAEVYNELCEIRSRDVHKPMDNSRLLKYRF